MAGKKEDADGEKWVIRTPTFTWSSVAFYPVEKGQKAWILL